MAVQSTIQEGRRAVTDTREKIRTTQTPLEISICVVLISSLLSMSARSPSVITHPYQLVQLSVVLRANKEIKLARCVPQNMNGSCSNDLRSIMANLF